METQKRPLIRKENEQTIIDEAIVGLYCGLCVRPAGLIARECAKHPQKVTIERLEEEFEKVDGKSIMGLMTLEAYKGKKLRITVDGITSDSEKLALRLYSGITTINTQEDYCHMNFNRYEK